MSYVLPNKNVYFTPRYPPRHWHCSPDSPRTASFGHLLRTLPSPWSSWENSGATAKTDVCSRLSLPTYSKNHCVFLSLGNTTGRVPVSADELVKGDAGMLDSPCWSSGVSYSSLLRTCWWWNIHPTNPSIVSVVLESLGTIDFDIVGM
jgi:hypothetical protein